MGQPTTTGTTWNPHPEWGPPNTPYYNKKLAEKEKKEAAAKAAKARRAKKADAEEAQSDLLETPESE